VEINMVIDGPRTPILTDANLVDRYKGRLASEPFQNALVAMVSAPFGRCLPDSCLQWVRSRAANRPQIRPVGC
jgi:hypothetical protein